MHALVDDDIKMIAMLRLTSIFPFSFHNYFYGASTPRVNFFRYLLGSFLGSAPFTLLLVYLGYAGRTLFITGTKSIWLSIVVGVTGVLCTVPLIYIYLKQQKRE